MLLEIAFGILMYIIAASGLFIRAMILGRSIDEYVVELLFYSSLFALTMLAAFVLKLIGF